MQITEFKYFYPEAPRLIAIGQGLFTEFSNDPAKIAEKKYNGTRLQLHYLDGKFSFWNRHEKELAFVPDQSLRDELVEFKKKLKGYCLFDGELRDKKTKGVRQKIILYDLFIWHNELLNTKPFWCRRSILNGLLLVEGEPLGITDQYSTNFKEVYDLVTPNDEIEGLVIKDKGGMLQLGRKAPIDSKWMWKVRKASGRYKF